MNDNIIVMQYQHEIIKDLDVPWRIDVAPRKTNRYLSTERTVLVKAMIDLNGQ